MRQAEETGKEKVRKICDILRKETLEPARAEAEEILRKAEEEAAGILQEAQERKSALLAEAEAEAKRNQAVFQTALRQAAKQTVEALKNEIQTQLFSPALTEWLSGPMTEDATVARLLDAVIEAVRKDGIDADLDVRIPVSVSARDINERLFRIAGKNLSNASITAGPLKGGVTVQLREQKLTIDVSDQALKEWVAKYVGQDFRKILFEVK